MKGHCKWWKADRGYGFLTGEDSQDYFVHYSDILGEGRKDLTPYEVVEFVAAKNAKGLKAVQVKAASPEMDLGGMNESQNEHPQNTGRETADRAGSPTRES